MNRSDQIVIIADDLTGALDAAAPFADRELKTFVSTGSKIDALPEVEVLSINVDTRRMTSAEAAGHTGDIVRSLAESGHSPTYIKIDSTLRGHPGTEIGVAAHVSEADLVIVSPSFPQTGRVVKDGQLLVHGTPLAETEVGRDALSPVESSNVAEVLRRDTKLPVFELSLSEVRSGQFDKALRALAEETPSGPSIVVCDSETEQELELIADAGIALSDDSTGLRVMFSGSAGLASALTNHTQDASNNNVKSTVSMMRPVLVVTASQRSLADEQISALEATGLAETVLLELSIMPTGEVGSVVVDDAEKTQDALSARRNVVLRASVDIDLTELSPDQVRLAADAITCSVGEKVENLVSEQKLGGLVIIGGDTAKAVLSSVGTRGIFLAAEPLPGVAQGIIAGGALDGVPIATKAGAFGDRQTLVKLFQKLLPDQELP